MTDESDKEKIIRNIYYDVEEGFGSIKETYQKANKILNNITLADVKAFLDKQQSRQIKGDKKYNSYVAKDPLQEIQIDLADFTKSANENDGYRYLFVAVDVFTKKIHAVPVKDKKPEESVRAMAEVLDKIGVPKTIYHDNEGSWNSKPFMRLINKHGIRQIISNTPAPFAETAVKTIKNMIFNRLEGLEKSREEWIEFVDPVLKKYNNTPHSTTGFKPNEADKEENIFQIRLNIREKATFMKKYPKLSVGDKVRTRIKKHTFKKGYDPTWSKEVFEIKFISKEGRYLLSDSATRKHLWSRHELLKVEE
jgi:hypothetical protein